MNPDIKKRWVAVLCSGEYQQGKFGLRNGADQYCCLGVLVDLAVKEGVVKWSDKAGIGIDDDPAANYYQVLAGADDPIGGSVLPPQVTTWAGLEPGVCNPMVVHDNDNNSLAGLNDGGIPFATIASVIEEQL